MKKLLSIIGTIIVIAFQSVALSAFFSLIQWLLNLLSISDKPSWGQFLYGAIGLFVILFLYNVYTTVKSMNQCKKDPVYNKVCEQTGITWRDYKSNYWKLQQIAQTYKMDFRLFVERMDGWETFDQDHDNKGCIMLIPNPEVSTTYWYYIKWSGPFSEEMAVDFLIKDFLMYMDNRKY